MAGEELNQSTIRPRDRAQARRREAIALTVLFHPDLDRIGETALLGPGEQPLSRLAPRFGRLGSGALRPLSSPWLSRQPLTLSVSGGAVQVTTSGEATALRIDGQPVRGSALIAATEVAEDVVLTLASRVVVLLHPAPQSMGGAENLGLVGESDAMHELRDRLLRVAQSSHPVLLRGETGTGKELVARAIVAASPRAGGPFVAVNAAAIPASVAVAELFGHARGAFTGAAAARDGLFASAAGGTLFLDEVGELSLEVQATLLRALESGEIQPVGAQQRRVDVRVISATDADLERAVEAGRFRRALYQRLASAQLVLPPLSARREDLGRLFRHFVVGEARLLGREWVLRTLDADPPWFSGEQFERLALHTWPGNVRQLKHVASALVMAARADRPLGDREVAELLGRSGAPTDAPRPQADHEPTPAAGDVGDEALLAALRANRWRPGATAKALGVSRSKLYALIDANPAIRRARDVSRSELEACLEECGGKVAAAAARLEVSERGLRLRMTELGLT